MVRGEFTDLLNSLYRTADTGGDLTDAPAAEAARLLRLDALTLALRSRRGMLELLWADPADPLGPELEDLQYTLGEGPTLEAARSGHAVIETDLGAAPNDRWPLFAPAACRTPVRAVIAVPLLLGVATAGVLTGYRTAPGPSPTASTRISPGSPGSPWSCCCTHRPTPWPPEPRAPTCTARRSIRPPACSPPSST